jgi:predicted phosphodiesterase
VKILFAGDIHGSQSHLAFVYKTAKANGCDAIWACGDFGYWPHYESGRRFLDAVDLMFEATGIPLYWTDGNHENHDRLDELVAEFGAGEPIGTSLGSKWVPRGCRVEWDGVRFMSYGGGYSVDWQRRRLGESWWSQELVSERHVLGLSDDPVDVLVTHDTPLGARLSYKDDIPESVDQRRILSLLVDKVQPHLVFSGHHHVRATFLSKTPKGWEATVRVLGRDTMGSLSVHVFDTTDIFRNSHDLELTSHE